MATCNSSRNNHRGLKIFSIIVSILLVVCLVASLLVIGRTTNGFKEIPEFDDEEAEEDTFVVDPEDEDEAGANDYGSPVNLSVVKIPEEDYEVMGLASSTVGAYTVTASYEPSNADIKDFSWSLALDTTWSGYKSSGDYTDYYGTVWSSSSSFNMSDYITLSEDDTLSCTVTCIQVFGCPIFLTFTVTDVLGTSVSADCVLNCNTYMSGFYWKAYSSQSCDVYIDVETTDPISDYTVNQVIIGEFLENGDSYSFSDRVFSVKDDAFVDSDCLSMDSRLVSIWYDFTQSSVSSGGYTAYYDSAINFYCFGYKFMTLDTERVPGWIVADFSASFDNYYFKDLLCYLEPVFDGVYSVGTLACTQSLSSAVESLNVSYSVQSGVDGSDLTSGKCTSTSCFSVDSCLTKISDENGVSLSRSNLGLGKVSSSFMKQFCDSSHPILNIVVTCGDSTITIPFYFSDITYFSVSLTGAFVNSSGLVF